MGIHGGQEGASGQELLGDEECPLTYPPLISIVFVGKELIGSADINGS